MKNPKSMQSVAVAALLFFCAVSVRAQTSVLGSINCGGGQATCNYVSTKSSGALSCTCMATCLSCKSSVPDVAASRAIEWGTYVNGFACTLPISVSIVGGTDTWGSSTYSSVYVQNTVTGVYVQNGSETSIQQDDCFDGLVIDNPSIGVFVRGS
jgi:hypothetical protein